MFNKAKHYDNAIQKVVIHLGKALNLPEGEDCYVKFREPSEREVLSLRTANDGELEGLEAFRNIFISALVDHDFYDGDEKMSNEDVINLLYEKVDTANQLIKEYSNAVFRSRANKDEEK